MKLSALFLLSLTIMTLGSCKREENPIETHRVYGQVINAYSGKAVPQATVRIYTTNNMAFLRYSTWKNIAYEGKTDDSGRFDIQYQAPKDFAKGIIFFKEGYTTYDQLRLIGSGNINADDFLPPNKFSKVHIKNINPFDEEDSVYVDINHIAKFGLKGKTIDTTLIAEYVWNYSQKITWTIFKNGQPEKTISYLNCIPLDTCDFKIHF